MRRPRWPHRPCPAGSPRASWSSFSFLAPLYRLWPSPVLLLIVQTLALALSAWPLYLTLKRWLDDEWTAAALTWAYVVYLPLHYVTMFDFHPTALMPVFLTTAIYAAERRRWRLYALALLGALISRADAAFVALGLGLLFAWRRWTKVGALTFTAGVLWLLLDFGLVVPLAEAKYGPDPLGLIGQRFGQFGATPAEIAVNMVRNPGRVAALPWTGKRPKHSLTCSSPWDGCPCWRPRG
ncbi:MAG: DUF2079 domain-containing protein [Ardenticatenia bacterium]|nr:DUF2079 domain-containing protein [Ardenticatenia bacterium]